MGSLRSLKSRTVVNEMESRTVVFHCHREAFPSSWASCNLCWEEYAWLFSKFEDYCPKVREAMAISQDNVKQVSAKWDPYEA